MGSDRLERERFVALRIRGYADGAVFFAEDIFGVQFCLVDGKVSSFESETGEKTALADSLDDWARMILDDYEVLTGFSVTHEWQSANGKLDGRSRLLPATPFVAGGSYALTNLRAIPSVEGMRYRGSLARQIRYVPDGATVRMTVRTDES